MSNFTSINPSQFTQLINALNNGGGGGGSTITVDDELSATSTNPVQNKVITTALKDKQPKITVASGTATWNTTYAGSAPSHACYWRRYGRMVTVYIYEAMMTPSCKNDGSSSIIGLHEPYIKGLIMFLPP